MGPGISLHPETQDLVTTLLPRTACPMVLDADALTALANHAELLGKASSPLVLTPHPGEMSVLTGLDVSKSNLAFFSPSMQTV